MAPRSILDISAELPSATDFSAAMQEIGAAPHAPGSATPQPAIFEDLGDPAGEQDVLFGRYRTVRELGRGGMGVVWLAQDTVLEVAVALKLVPPAVVRDAEGLLNLKKEVLRGMALTHPNIVRVHSFEQQGSAAGIVMEHVEGESLAQRKARQPDFCFDPQEVRGWLEQLCTALDYAHHEARIAHRDVKPGNLLLTPSGRLKVADFGLASSLSESRSRISARMGVSGTPPYMSPQQALGQQPTHLDDIYSVGATLYELLTGSPPFFRGDILGQVLRITPSTLAARRAEIGLSHRAPIPQAWERLVAACLAKEPKDRPSSGAAMLQLLDETAETIAASTAQPIPRPAGASTLLPISGEMALELPPGELRIIVPPTCDTVHVEPKPVARSIVRQIWVQPIWNGSSMLLRGLAVAVQTTGELVLAVLSPVLKIAGAIVVLWALLHLKQKWDSGAAQRQALAERQTALEIMQASAAAPPLPRTTALPAPAPMFLPPPPPPPGPGFGPPESRFPRPPRR